MNIIWGTHFARVCNSYVMWMQFLPFAYILPSYFNTQCVDYIDMHSKCACHFYI